MIITNIHFIRPWWLLLLLPLTITIIILLKKKKAIHCWSKVIDPQLLPHLLMHRSGKSTSLPYWILSIAWLITTLALAGPSWSKNTIPVYRNQDATVILLSLDLAMNVSDLKPNRLQRAKYKLQDILKKLKEGQTGLIVYTEEPYVVSPLTEDTATIAAMVPVLNPELIPVSGNNISRALNKAKQLIKQGGSNQGRILLLTDNQPQKQDFITATRLYKQGITLSILGIGTDQGAPIPTEQGFLKNKQGQVILSRIDHNSLQQLSTAGGGYYSNFTNDDTDLQTILFTNKSPQQIKKTQQHSQQWQDQGRWLILFLLPLAALAFRRGWYETL